MASRLNMGAPPAYNGLAGNYPNGYVDVDFTYVYQVTLTASQFLRDQVLSLATDADFVWRALLAANQTGAYAIRFSDSQGYYLSNAMIPYSNFILGTVPIPYPMFPELVLPAGGKIGIDIQNLTAAPNTVDITFRGVKRYRLPA